MDATGPIGMTDLKPAAPEEVLARLFGDYRAEWPQDLFRELFTPPPYFTKLVTPRPSLLRGGRGTGKTTALKSLRFDADIHDASREPIPGLGIYVKFNKNRVRAFEGPELNPSEWQQAFAHYFNMLVCRELCELTKWLIAEDRLTKGLSLELVVRSLGVDSEVKEITELALALEKHLTDLELFVNNPATSNRPTLSMAEAPLSHFAKALKESGSLGDGVIFLCLDEYENLTEDHQAVVNTYIKNAEPPLAYKIGVRRNGLKTRATIDDNDLLNTPDDYAEIDIATEKAFDDFATSVVNLRLALAQSRGVDVPGDAADFLEEMAFEEEARKLGAARIAKKIRDAVEQSGDRDLAGWAAGKADEEIYFAGFWAAGARGNVVTLLQDWRERPEAWKERIGNYGYASLFWLSRGRKGARTRKFYSGLTTFLLLASGNIRYFLELFDEAIREQCSGALGCDGRILLSPEAQTAAAKTVGRRRLGQLESLTEHGVDLKRLVLALGKVFFELGRNPSKAPETNSFILSGSPVARREVESILGEGVAHMAFEATPRTKATAQTEMRDAEYRIHPIYAPFFEFSHRRKRRATFAADDLLLVRENPRRAIAKLIGRSRTVVDGAEPMQMQMFSQFYDGGDE